MTNFAVQSRNLGSTEASLRNAGDRLALRDSTILIDDARAIDQPEDVARLFVRAGTPQPILPWNRKTWNVISFD